MSFIEDTFMSWTTHPSDADASVNHTLAHADGGIWETRWVQRSKDYGIVYVSSHTGCAFSCRFCHLTATKQTMMTPADENIYLAQLRQSLGTYRQRREEGLPAIDKLHINFMARGEPLDNPTVLHKGSELFAEMEHTVHTVQPHLDTHFLLSSILPNTLTIPLADVLTHPQAHLYYSLYSLNPQFRKRWVPKALPATVGLDLCQEYQKATGKRVVLHWAFIEGQNDSEQDIDEMLEAVAQRQLRAKFNLVRYNPHDQRHGVETEEAKLQHLFAKIQRRLGDPESRIVPRVGFDVKASCGMFVVGE